MQDKMNKGRGGGSQTDIMRDPLAMWVAKRKRSYCKN